MRNFLILSFVLFALGCASIPGVPGYISKSKNDYDGKTQIYMQPGWAGDILVGALWNEDLGEDVLLEVRNNTIKNFSFEHPNLAVKIDGTETKLSPISKETNCEVSSSTSDAHCSQRYRVKLDFIRKMESAKSVKFRLDLRDSFVTGNLDMDSPTTARFTMDEFLKAVDGVKSPISN